MVQEIRPAQPSVVDETCELERKKKEAVSVAVDVITFAEHIYPKEYPTLHSKHICLQTDTDITAVLPAILKLSKKVKSVDLLKVLHILLPADGDGPSFYAILDRTARKSVDDTLVLNVPIRIFITGDLALDATMVGKEGMDI
jgi:hypothetical protein